MRTIPDSGSRSMPLSLIISRATVRERVSRNRGLVLFTVTGSAALFVFIVQLVTGPSRVMLTVDTTARATRVAISFRHQTGKGFEPVWQSDSLPARDSIGPIMTGARGLLTCESSRRMPYRMETRQ